MRRVISSVLFSGGAICGALTAMRVIFGTAFGYGSLRIPLEFVNAPLLGGAALVLFFAAAVVGRVPRHSAIARSRPAA